MQSSSGNKRRWREKIQAEARKLIQAPDDGGDLVVVITFFYDTLPDFDTDNISKPICDALAGIAFRDDRQLLERNVRIRNIAGSFRMRGVDPSVAVAICEGKEFVAIQLHRAGKEVEVI